MLMTSVIQQTSSAPLPSEDIIFKESTVFPILNYKSHLIKLIR